MQEIFSPQLIVSLRANVGLGASPLNVYKSAIAAQKPQSGQSHIGTRNDRS
jgi:hypothetical protein